MRLEEERLSEQRRLQAEQEELLRSEQLAREWQERHKVFRELLEERKFPPFTSWKKAQPQLVYDTRYSGIFRQLYYSHRSIVALPTDADRKAAFDSFMRHHVTEVNRQSNLSKKAKKDAFAVRPPPPPSNNGLSADVFRSLFERW